MRLRGLAEEETQLLAGPGNAGLHGAHADALDPAHLLVGKPLQLREHEGGGLLERQGVQGRVELTEQSGNPLHCRCKLRSYDASLQAS